MTDTTVSDARLAEMLADAISERDCTLIGDDCCYDFYPSELVNALTELQRLRTQPVNEPAEWQVEAEGLIEELLDAQQDINLAANTHMDQSLCDASALIDKVETFIRRSLRATSIPKEPAPVVTDEPTHRHKKRGTEYVLIGIGKMQAEDWYEATTVTRPDLNDAEFGKLNKVDMREVAIYRSATDPTEIWVRPREEFEDGRFEALTAALQKQESGE